MSYGIMLGKGGYALNSDIVIRPYQIGENQPIPEMGDYLRTQAGRAYFVTDSNPIKGDERRRCIRCIRVNAGRPNPYLPADAVVHTFSWGRHSDYSPSA